MKRQSEQLPREFSPPSYVLHSLAKLKLPIPLNLTVVDIGGGIKTGISAPEIYLEEIACRAPADLGESLTAPGVWQSEPVDLDLKGFMSSFTSNHSTQTLASDRPNVNLAIVSEEYINLSLGLGYHFTWWMATFPTIETATTSISDSSARYRIHPAKSTGESAGQNLERNDFAVESKGDMIIGRIKKIDRPNMENKFRLIGQLIGYTRQLDVLLRTDRDINFFTNQFFEEEQAAHPLSS